MIKTKAIINGQKFDVQISLNNGIIFLYYGKKHSPLPDMPAVIRSNGTVEYWKEGYLHRENGPAIQCLNGDYVYMQNGYTHREDGPAIKENNKLEYWVNNKKHRIDGPAVEYIVPEDQIKHMEIALNAVDMISSLGEIIASIKEEKSEYWFKGRRETKEVVNEHYEVQKVADQITKDSADLRKQRNEEIANGFAK